MRKLLTIYWIIGLFVYWIITPVVLAGPQSTTYEMVDYDFGSGGTANTDSTTYSLFGNTGQLDGSGIDSTNYTNLPGLTYQLTASVPATPTFTNPSNYTNRLHIVLNTGTDASDVKYAIAISPDAFSSTTQYVQADDTPGSSQVFQTKSVWGASGFDIVGLSPNTTYTVKVSAMQGKFTQSAYGPTASAATINPTLSFSLNSNSVSLNQINPASVVSSSSVTVTVSTTAAGGAVVYAYDQNSALSSSSTGGSLPSATADLGATAGYGLQVSSVTQSAGGPMEKLSPFNGASDNVGALSTNKVGIVDSTSAPVTSGQGVFVLKAKASNTTKAASDYSDIVTVITAATF